MSQFVLIQGTQDGNKERLPSSSKRLQPPPMVHTEETKDEKTQDTAPPPPANTWGAYQRNNFNKPRLCIFPYIEKC